MLTSAVLEHGLAALCSFVYLGSMLAYGRMLVIPAIIIVLVQLVMSTIYVYISMNLQRKNNEVENKLQGLVFSLFSGIQK